MGHVTGWLLIKCMSVPLQMDFLEHSAVEDVIIMGVVLEEACRIGPCPSPFPPDAGLLLEHVIA